MSFITDLINKITNFRVKVGDKLNTLKNQIGQLNSLTTNDKTSLVEAVNEVNRKAVVHDGTLTLGTGNGLSGSGSFAANQQVNSSVEFKINDETISKINNGQTAYDWGNHALAGYLTPTSLSNYYQSGDVNIPAKGGDYRVFPNAGNSANFDWNEKTGLGFYKDTFDAGDVATYNAPKSGFYGYVENLRYSTSGNLTQYAHPYRVTDGKWMRSKYGSTWTSWVEFIHTGNLDTNVSALGFIKSSELSGYVPTSRTITINGLTQNLSANRTWTVPDTVTTLRGTESGTYTSGDITLLAGANTTITQSGANITIASTNIITAQAFYESSLSKYKTNIKPYEESALDIVKSLDVVTYDRTDSDISNKIGIIADDSHEDVLNEEKTAVDLYKTIFVLTKAVQELDYKNKTLEDRLSRLEKLVNKLTSDL